MHDKGRILLGKHERDVAGLGCIECVRDVALSGNVKETQSDFLDCREVVGNWE